MPVLIERFVERGSQHLTGQGAFSYDGSVDRALARVGAPAVPALVKILDGPDENMAVCAANALVGIGPAARAAVPSLIRAIERHEPRPDWVIDLLAMYASRALGRIGPDARAAIPALNRRLERLNGNDLDVVIALDRIGAPPVRALLEAFLRDGDPYVADVLAGLGPKAREATPALLAALTDRRLQVRISAAVALAHIDPPAPEAIPFLIEGLKKWGDKELSVEGVPDALAHLGPRARSALDELSRLVDKGSADESIVRALVQIDPEGKECVPALIAAMKNDDYALVDVTANCLRLLGPRAKDAIPVLRDTLTRQFEESFANGDNPQASAAGALRRVDPEGMASIPALAHALSYRHVVAGDPDESVDWDVAETAAEVLGSYGEKAASAIPVLIDVVQSREKDDERWHVRQAAAMALGRIGPRARAAIPDLRAYIQEHERRPLRQSEAVAALYRLAPDGREIAKRWLAEHQSAGLDPRRGIGPAEGRVMVLAAMGRTSFEGDLLTRRHLELLDYQLIHTHPADGDPLDRSEWIVQRIARLGVAGRLAIPRLKELQSYPNPFVRLWAAEALECIMPPAR